MCIDCGCVERTSDSGNTHKHDHDHHHTHSHNHDHDHEPKSSQSSGSKTLIIEESLLAKNDRLAQRNRAFFRQKKLFVLNLVSSPGSGKTSILERTLTEMKNLRFAVLEGDQQTSNDADRIAATGVPAYQINTGAGCHLDAHMVGHGVEHFDLDALDILMIENVGNLVCPASFDLGEHHKVAVLSTTEGEDKPIKYPQMFRAADLMIINKIDLLPYLDFDIAACRDYARQVNPEIKIIELSVRSGEGMDQWYEWLNVSQLDKEK